MTAAGTPRKDDAGPTKSSGTSVANEDGASSSAGAATPVDEGRWVTATAQVRTTAQWVISTAGAAAAVIFGAGPIIAKGELTGGWLWLRVLVLLLSVAVGAAGVIYLIARTAKVLLPYVTRLDRLPPTFQEQINRDPASYLPDDIASVDAFRRRYRDERVGAEENRAQVDRLTDEAAEAHEQQTELDATLARLQRDRDRAARQGKPTTAIDAEIMTGQAALAAVTTQIDEQEAEIAARARQAKTFEYNLAVFARVKEELLGQSAFAETANTFTGYTGKMVLAGFAAVLGGAAYLILWSYKPPEPTPAATPTAKVATLVRHADGSSDRLWSAAGLDGCDGGSGRLPVLVDGGDGTSDDPYVVRTLGTDFGCEAIQFTVIDEVAAVILPAPKEISVSYEPERERDVKVTPPTT